jgi:large subunit ribosomal protein L30
MSQNSTITVRQVRSAAMRTQRTKAVLRALGLGRIGNQKSLPANPAVLGMIARVEHLVEVCNK